MIDGILYRDMVISAANAIDNLKENVNSLNVFPVPDGDTGINMSLTMQAGKKTISDFNGNLSECSEKVAGALLRGGRGNSGVILSLFFRGISKELKGCNTADAKKFSDALLSGVDAAYKAVRNPTEGTVLTVMRVSSESVHDAVEANPDISIEDFFNIMHTSAKETLDKTPELLPILKQANVVDAGGKGFLIIVDGMKSVVEGNGIIVQEGEQQIENKADFSSFNTEDIKFSYCTECIIDKKMDGSITENKVNGFREFIMNSGDSGVFIDDNDFIKFHIHTNDPGKILSECLMYGSLAKVKIENMKAQHTSLSEINEDSSENKINDTKHVSAVPEKKYGFVSVAAGDGLCSVFSELGADEIVEGGQTMNPSTDDLINAIESTPSENVFVMPNNKNIYMAAKQAEELVTDKNVTVIKTMSVPQGISAMIAFDPDSSVEENIQSMSDAMSGVKTLKITFAARNSTFEDKEIKEGQILGLVENSVKYVSDSCMECMKNLIQDMKDFSYITLFYGSDITESDAEKMAEFVENELGSDYEVSIVSGGQPVYYYIISAE